MNVGGLFSGVGGWELGLERAGMRVLWHCESDPFCRRVLAEHWPGVACYPDVSELRGSDVAPVDVLCGGFPCQDLSYAGQGAGIGGARSGLWSEYARLIGELRPRYVCVENVSALLGRGFGVVLGDLAEIGYDAEWDCLPASAFGAHHQRDRVWIVAYPHTNGQGRGFVAQHNGRSVQLGRSASGGHADGLRDEVADTTSERCERGRGAWDGWFGSADGGGPGAPAGTGPENPWTVEPSVGRVVDGFPGRVEQVRALGNALVPQIAEWIGRRIVAYEEGRASGTSAV